MPLREKPKNRSLRDNNDELRTAEQLFKKRDFDGVLRHLAPQVFLYRAEPRYYQLLGISSLYVNDFDGAYSYLLRGLDLAPRNIEMQMGLAIAHLWRKEEPQSIALLLAILETRHNHRSAKRALDTIKRAPDSPEWRSVLGRGELRRLYPAPPVYWERVLSRGSLTAGIVLVLAVVAFGIVQLVNALGGVRTQRDIVAQSTPEPDPTTVTGANGSAQTGPGDFVNLAISQGRVFYTLTQAEVDQLSQNAIGAFREYRDNRSRIALNKLMLSNARSADKEKHRSLYQYYRKPDFTNFRDNALFADIEKDTPAYDGSFVRWKGRVAEIKKENDRVRFALFVGYETGTIAQGKVYVYLPFPVEIFDTQNVELIGKVHVGSVSDIDFATGSPKSAGLDESNVFWLEATSIRQIQGLR